jgi:lipopolysaccharide transport system permease protein
MTDMSVPASPSLTPADPASRPTRIAADAPELLIAPRRGWIGVDWGELVRYRELLFFLVWRDVKVKYKQAILGVAWAIFVPVLSMLIYTVVGNFAGFNARVGTGVPYAIYIYSGLLPWVFLQQSISNGGMSLVNQQALMSKIYLPRLFIPASTIGSAIVDMLLSAVVFAALLSWYGFTPSWQIVFLVPLILLQVIAGLGLAFLLSAATVMYRDLRFLLPFIAQVGIWLTAVVFPQAILERYADWLALNPLAGIVSGWRSAILGTEWRWLQLASSIVFCPAIFVIGLFYFRRVERRFADIA